MAVLGRNGVGKTTLCRSIVGFTPARAGRVIFNDVEITRLPAHKIFHMHLNVVPQGRRIFSSLTVEENLAIARQAADEPQRPKLSATPEPGARSPAPVGISRRSSPSFPVSPNAARTAATN